MTQISTCQACGEKITEIHFHETGSYQVEDMEIISGGGILSITHTCGHILTQDQCMELGLLE
jgi:hypothetical protein